LNYDLIIIILLLDNVVANIVTQPVIMDGKAVSQHQLDVLKQTLATDWPAKQPTPHLVVMLIGDNPASQVYVKKKAQTAEAVGMRSTVLTYPADTSQAHIEAELARLNADADVHGILVQLPLPDSLQTERILNLVDPAKDVDGFNPVNMGHLLAGNMPPALPCTPAGMMTLLNHYQLPIAGQHAVVVGRSTIVGKPMALLLLQEHATVTICHSRTQDLQAVCRQADILVAAIGKPHFITADFVKPGTVVLDVGINRLPDGKLVGDVDYAAVAPLCKAITPVPGGVGPMTIATLLWNTFYLANARLPQVRPT
jgi:methylenetetrahydrofolate dehydrogenase (NADP+) / methenyltetrahydrofolate cyclohydrolase